MSVPQQERVSLHREGFAPPVAHVPRRACTKLRVRVGPIPADRPECVRAWHQEGACPRPVWPLCPLLGHEGHLPRMGVFPLG